MNLQSALEFDEGSAVDDIPDEVLLAHVQAALPAYLLRRARAKAPFLAIGLGLLAVATLAHPKHDAVEAAHVGRPSPNALDVTGGDAPTSSDALSLTADPLVASLPFPALIPNGFDTTTTSAAASTPEPSVIVPLEQTPLVITDSGYNSATSTASAGFGTPLEQDPGNGSLPVKAAAGRHLKRSFVRLGGQSKRLHLALDAQYANAGFDTATIDACPITARGWQGTRGGDFTGGPNYDATKCIAGRRLSDGTWVFDLAKIDGGPTRPDGIALVPGANDSGTWDIAFLIRTLSS